MNIEQGFSVSEFYKKDPSLQGALKGPMWLLKIPKLIGI